ncbi:nitroreductase family protein [Alkalinema pantanalense CENA528]|uniref:nitroreductase family protein n=1 Tax=Alkalinema pantanalense TaxID=1620705 RepID=UPI003D6F9DA3
MTQVDQSVSVDSGSSQASAVQSAAADGSRQDEGLDIQTVILKRRSIKSFESTPIAPEILRRLVELTVAAPSSYNLQDWRIIIIQDDSQKQALSDAAYGQQQVLQAPVTFVFAADPNAWKQDLTPIYQQGIATGAWTAETVEYFKLAIPRFQMGLGDKGREYAIKDAMIAATHLVLAAEGLGLSTCFMNGWEEDKIKAAIGAENDPDLAIAVIIPVGYASEVRGNPGRLPFAYNVFVDKFGSSYKG